MNKINWHIKGRNIVNTFTVVLFLWDWKQQAKTAFTEVCRVPFKPGD